MKSLIRIVVCFLCLAVLLAPRAPADARQVSTPGAPPTLLQFTSAGHVLGFAVGAVYAADGSYAYRVEFLGAAPTAPVADSAQGEAGRAAPLSRVSYPGLWPGVTLTYDAPGGAVLRSSYRLEPFADPAAIRLRYNVPVELEGDGALRLAYAAGVARESAPVAWQDVEGQRLPVAVAFQIHGEREVGFSLGAYDPAYPLTVDPTLAWNTFLGGSGYTTAQAVAVDGSGNVYLAGSSRATWGSPVRAYTAQDDALVAKLDGGGALVWHTFLGGSQYDSGGGIAVDSIGNILVAGTSDATWGSPVRAYSGSMDTFVAQLDNSGGLTWSTFLGGTGADYGHGVAFGGDGSVVVAGYGDATWGSPVRAYTGGMDAFAAQLDSGGGLAWNTFLGGSGNDMGLGVAAEGGGVYLAGYGDATWGSPVRAYTALDDAFVVRLDSSGGLAWNTFLGGSGDDSGRGIAVKSGSAYVTGASDAAWGSPIRAYTDSWDAFAARLDSGGGLTWNTFLGGTSMDSGHTIAVSGFGDVYVAGWSTYSWGSPVRAYTGGRDGFAVRLNSSGGLTWNTFLGGEGFDYVWGLAVGGSGQVLAAGWGTAGWGSPVQPFAGDLDAYAAQLDGCGELTWNTFLSAEAEDAAYAIAVDDGGHIYVAGRSNAEWGSGIKRHYTALYDAFVACLDSSGALVWTTFLGGVYDDAAYAVTIWASCVAVAGYSEATWGAPILPHHQWADAFVAILDPTDGALQYNTFLGGLGWDYGYGIAGDGADLVVAGYSNDTWGSPVRAYTGNGDAFVARLDSAAVLTWNTFLGGSGSDYGYAIAADGGKAYVAGVSSAAWGCPVRAYTALADAFVARVSSFGALDWNSFLGGTGWDEGYGIALDGSGSVLVVGSSNADWGSPVRAYSGGADAFVARLDAAGGGLTWNTFLGGSGWDTGAAIAVKRSGDLAVVGSSDAAWGDPIRDYTALEDAFVAQVDSSGALSWNTFLGRNKSDIGRSIAVNVSGRAIAAGYSDGLWGAPIRAYSAGWDGWVAKPSLVLSQGVFLPLVAR